MKVSDMRRGVTLAEALQAWPALAKAAERKKPKRGYDRRVLFLSIEDASEAGSEGDGSVEIDLDTAAMLLPGIRQTLIDEAARLGVDPDEPAGSEAAPVAKVDVGAAEIALRDKFDAILLEGINNGRLPGEMTDKLLAALTVAP